jgi:hypothetical protein
MSPNGLTTARPIEKNRAFLAWRLAWCLLNVHAVPRDIDWTPLVEESQ